MDDRENALEAHSRTLHVSMREFSLIRTVTVGFGFAPNLLTSPNQVSARGLNRLACITAGRELHPAPRIRKFYRIQAATSL